MTLILSLDFGGTKLAAATVNQGSRQWLNYERRISPVGANATTDLAIMRELARSLLGDAKPIAIGVSYGGPVDATTGTVRGCSSAGNFVPRLLGILARPKFRTGKDAHPTR